MRAGGVRSVRCGRSEPEVVVIVLLFSAHYLSFIGKQWCETNFLSTLSFAKVFIK